MFDPVEMIMEVEQRFNVTIPDEQAERMITVGDVYLYLLRKTRRSFPTPCPTSQAFYRVRRTLTEDFGVARGQVRPATQLRKLFPAASRSLIWPRLAVALGIANLPDWPGWHVPSVRSFGITLAVATAGSWFLFAMLQLAGGINGLPIAIGLLIWFLLIVLVCEVFGIAWIACSLDYFNRIRVLKVHHLIVRLILQGSDQSTGGVAADPSPRAVWEDLVTLLAAQTSVPAQQIYPEQSFFDLAESC